MTARTNRRIRAHKWYLLRRYYFFPAVVIAGNYKMANDIPINDIPFDRDTLNLIDYDSCKEVVHGMVHDANHTVQSIESLTNDLWALQKHQGHLPVDDPRRQNPNDIGVPMGNNIDLYNGQQTRGVTKNTRPGY